MGVVAVRRLSCALVVCCASLAGLTGCGSHERVETALASASAFNMAAGFAGATPSSSLAPSNGYTITPVAPPRSANVSSGKYTQRAMTTMSPAAAAATTAKPLHAMTANPAADLRAMTFNLRVPFLLDGTNHWGFRKGNLVKTIKDFNPDLLGTQECVAAQADYLREELPEYGFRGVGRDDGKRGGEMTAVFYRRDKFKELDHGYFWLSERPTVPGSKSWGAWFTRMCTWVKLQPLDGSPAFCVFNAHLDNMSGRARVESARLMREKIAEYASGMPVIVTGDFNADAGTEPYQMLLAGDTLGVPQMLFDAFRLANPKVNSDEGTRHDFNGKRGGNRIDWILVNGGFQPLHAEINHARSLIGYPSDHFPVQAILRPVVPGKSAMPLARVE
jgi:endonuclease/exonuclease/phosphatase family metal-dependent hydrolase